MTLGEPPVVSDRAAHVDVAEQSLVDHSLAFGRLDILARQMRDAGAPDSAVAWASRLADIAYRAARSELNRTARPA